MRRIDKTKCLSTKYNQWVNELNRSGERHPENSPYYIDVVMNLLHCQAGVCAYTEMDLCDPGHIKIEKWLDGRYIALKMMVDMDGNITYSETKCSKVETFGTLDHFNPKLKGGKFWNWDNLFVIHSKINTAKGAQEVDDILKPDLPGYDPFKLLAYNQRTHCFYAHPDRSEDERLRIYTMIKVLQLNYDFVLSQRKKFFNKLKKYNRVKEELQVDQFFTAYEMVKSAKKQEVVEE
jgi:5-methylcytosine-specific restriction endonuclease McrA